MTPAGHLINVQMRNLASRATGPNTRKQVTVLLSLILYGECRYVIVAGSWQSGSMIV